MGRSIELILNQYNVGRTTAYTPLIKRVVYPVAPRNKIGEKVGEKKTTHIRTFVTQLKDSYLTPSIK